MKYLVFDATNLLYRTFYTHKSDDDETIASLASYAAVVTMNKYFKNFKPDKVIMCFDNGSWRKDYTKSDECVSQKLYKGNRRQKMTPREKERYDIFLDHIKAFQELLREHTSVITLSGKGLEADDLMAGLVQIISVKEPESQVIIVTADQDMIQLLEYDFVQLFDPVSGKPRSLKDWNGDAELFLFEKCVRGDIGDNVQNAFPKVRKTRIHSAYKDEFERINLMNEKWMHPDGREMHVGKLFKENQLLMDLRCQPEYIQKQIIETIVSGLENPGKFSYFHLMKYLGQYKLKVLANKVDQYISLLSC